MKYICWYSLYFNECLFLSDRGGKFDQLVLLKIWQLFFEFMECLISLSLLKSSQMRPFLTVSKKNGVNDAIFGITRKKWSQNMEMDSSETISYCEHKKKGVSETIFTIT